MRAPAVSFAKRFFAAMLAALLTFTLVPASALAEGEGNAADAPAEEPQEVSAPQSDASSDVAPMRASGLVGNPSSFVSADVALDSEPIIGSFTVDGMTFAVTDGSDVELVGVSPDRQQVMGPQDADGSPVAPMLASEPDGSDAGNSTLAVPESIAYNGIDYGVASIGAYAFYLSGVTAVELPATVTDVDDRAFRSSDVAAVEVADGNPTYSSFDGALYDAAQLSLLLIPEGKQGTVLLPKTAEVAPPSVFSHCSLVQAIAVEEGSAAFASENGLLYDASLTTLLRIPAGATDIVIHDGCTTIAAGAMEACASLATITAPASVTSISPDVFTSVPTVSLPAVAAVADDSGVSTGATEGSSEQASSTPDSGSATTQLTAMVALSSADDDLPEVDPAGIEVSLAEGALPDLWMARGLNADGTAEGVSSGVSLQTAASYSTLDTSGIWLCAPTSEMYYYIARSGAWVRGDFEVTPYEWTWWEFPADDFSSCLNTSGAVIRRLSGAGLGTINGVHFNHPALTYWVPWFFIAMDQGNATSVKYGTSPRSLMALGSSDVLGFNVSNMQGQLYVSFDDADQYAVSVSWDLGGATSPDGVTSWVSKGASVTPPRVVHDGFRFLGWFSADGVKVSDGSEAIGPVEEDVTFYARWTQDFDLVFDTSSEPGDEDYPGIEKPDETVNVESGPTVIEDPKRPGYVFQGWTIPNAEGTEAIDQDLVYKDETDGKWYVDASKLPDYANDEGRVELTARWTSVISVDVPSAVTFYADVVTQGNESREGAASSAFGQNKVASQSGVDLCIVGLESTAVATQGSTLGADSILKKSASATPSSSTQKLFSLYPTDKAFTPDDLQDPDAVSQAKPSDAVDFALDDILLEKSFAPDAFTIPAGDTLNLGYRLNLAETGTELDYDTLATLDEGQSASIANISYTFAADVPTGLFPTGSIDDPLYVTVDEAFIAANGLDGNAIAGTYGLADIKAAAEDLSTNGAASTYWPFYKALLDAQVMSNGNPGLGPYFKVKINGIDWDLQLIGICQDGKSDDTGKAGLTFQMRDLFSTSNVIWYPGSGSYDPRMNLTSSNIGGWASSAQRNVLRTMFWDTLHEDLQHAIEPVVKYQQIRGGTTEADLQMTADETVWIPSMYEIFGLGITNYNEAEALTTVVGYSPFQYMAYQRNGASTTNTSAIKKYYTNSTSSTAFYQWCRSASRTNAINFCCVNSAGMRYAYGASSTYGIAPCFCL